MQLKVVLFPEPFGPMRPRISPSSTAKDTSLTAKKPPNFFVRPETRSIAIAARPRLSAAPRQRAKAWPFGSGITASMVLIAAGQTTFVSPLTSCITAGVERSFCPAIGVPGGKNLTP